MDWKQLLAYITGSVDQALLLRNEYPGHDHHKHPHQGMGNVVLLPATDHD
jgi:hypothetical protein